MLAKRPPLGWNSWNTFGEHISDALIREMADRMVSDGYLEAGYEYLVIDDCWSLKERDRNGLLVPDPAKFPYGMKALADYVHSRGLKFGMYSCAGVQTCAGYPSSYDHEFVDAQTFADWGVDYLKYDFCNFPVSAEGKNRYAVMSMALKATGRDILFAACNWGTDEPWRWMNSLGAHMYRSTGDIQDNFQSFSRIARSQLDNFCMSGPGCYNDIDMLIVGMHGKGNVANGGCSDLEYRTHFALWCLFQSPLMIGGDLSKMDDVNLELLKNKELLALNQDAEARNPMMVRGGDRPIFFKHLESNEYALAFFNFSDRDGWNDVEYYDLGLTVASGYGFKFRDIFSGEDLGVSTGHFTTGIKAHDCRILRGTLVEK